MLPQLRAGERHMERVAVVGSPGAGKTTFSLALAGLTGLPVVHLDKLYWKPGWVEPSAYRWRKQVAEVAAAPRWIVDGNYGGTLDLRLARADTVIALDFPASLCLLRATRRIAEGYGRVRPDLAAGCPERWDLTFLAYIARFGRNGGGRNRMLERLQQVREDVTVVTLQTPREARAFLRRL